MTETGDDKKTRSTTGAGPSSSKPPSRSGSRTDIAPSKTDAYSRLAAGYSARAPSSTRSHGTPTVEAVPEPEKLLALGKSRSAQHTKADGGSAPPSKSKDEPASASDAKTSTGPQPVRIDPDELVKVQGICQSENAPLRHDIQDIRDRIADISPSADADLQRQFDNLRADQLKFQNQQKSQFEALLERLPDAEVLASLSREVRTVRQDHNSLMERDSRVNPPPAESTQDANAMATEARVRELETQLATLRGLSQVEDQPARVPDPEPVDEAPRRQGRAEHRRDFDSPYSSDDDPAYYGEAYREDHDDPTARIRFFDRVKGPAYLTLRAERPSDPTFDRLMNYRYYRLHKRSAALGTDVMIDGQRRLKALQRSLEATSKFDGKDPIMVFAFRTRFTEEADLNGLTEAQALVALPRFLKDEASASFQTAQSSGRTGGVSSWSEAVHFLLTSYATPSAMREAVLRVHDTKQKGNEDEQTFNARLCQAIYRCGNVFSEAQKITFFVNGLLPDIRSRVARHRESIPRHAVRYNKIVQYARDEGETARAQRVSSRSVTRGASPGTQALYLHDHAEGHEDRTPQAEQLLLLGQGQSASTATQPISDHTSDLPSTRDLEGPQEELYMVRPPPVPHSDRRTDRNRPGWKSNNPLVCFSCFELDDHVSPNCKADPLDFGLIVRNYEALTPQQQALVPNGVGTYQLAKRCLAASHAKTNNPTGSKND